MKPVLFLLTLCFAAFAWPVHADTHDDCSPDEKECAEIGRWQFSIGMGFGGRTNPVVGNDDIPIFIVPNISYYGERFFWETDIVGFTLFESDHHMFNMIGTISYDQIYFNEWGVGDLTISAGGGENGRVNSNFQNDIINRDTLSDTVIDLDPGTESRVQGPVEQSEGAIDLDNLHDRDIAGLAGFEYLLQTDFVNLSLQALQDITSVHDGNEVRLALSRLMSRERHALNFTLGAEWKDRKTLDYYFGVRPDEVEQIEHAYVVGDDLTYFLKADWRYRLNRKWELRAVFHHRWLGDKIQDSPLVDEDSILAGFLGGVYHF